jgi:hypothetical protein
VIEFDADVVGLVEVDGVDVDGRGDVEVNGANTDKQDRGNTFVEATSRRLSDWLGSS